MVAFNIQFSAIGPAMYGVALVVLTLLNWSAAHAAGAEEHHATSMMRINAGASVFMVEDRQKGASVPDGMEIRVGAPINDRDTPRCSEKMQPLCRDLATSEFQITALRFMLPEVRGLSPKRLNIRRNSISASYTFR